MSEELISIADHPDVESETDLTYFRKVYGYPPRFSFLVHAAEHGVEHRTEAKPDLAHVGFDTPDLDGWVCSQAAGYGPEV